jgi:hypothetical protein
VAARSQRDDLVEVVQVMSGGSDGLGFAARGRPVQQEKP